MTTLRQAVRVVVARATTILRAGGVLLLALWFLGAAGIDGPLSYDASDNWLHFLLGIFLLGVAAVWSAGQAGGFSSSPRR